MISKFNFVIGIIAVAAGIVAILTYLELSPFRSDGASPPVLTCILDIHPTNDEFLIFIIKNEGLVPALSLTVDHFTMRYYKDQRKIRIGGGNSGWAYGEPGRRWLFSEELLPNGMISKVAGESALRDSEKAIDLLFFYATFLDSADREGEKTCRYFIDGDRIYTEVDFLKHEHYEHVSSQMEGFETRMLSKLGGPMRSKRQ